MTRSPLAAWRKLFAIGGAPAASHVTLSRAPSSDRLLDPLAGARIAHLSSLDVLARPLDVGSLLSRVANAAYSAENPAAAASGAEVTRVRQHARPDPEGAPQFEFTHALTIAAPGASSRKRPPSHAAIETNPPRSGGSAGPVRPAEKQIPGRFAPRMAMSDALPPISRQRFAKNEGTDEGVAAVTLPSSAGGGEATSRSRLPASVSFGARVGANARVVLNAAVANVDRLLAIGAPTPSVTAQGRTPARANPSPSPTRDVARLLADVVDRARAASRVSATAQDSAHSVVSRRTFEAPPAESQPSTHAVVSSSEADHTGGFRGLARRTLTPTHGPRHVQVQRIEPETRISSDLALDTLDDKVADSLARVLEREARRHGIDLAEARS